ncbi:MAG TPA: LptA/OstA family protein [Terracidiphilus sp.]
MRLTIERLRTLVLAAGALLVVALVAFLVLAHWKSRFILREIPKRLGVDIQQESNQVLIARNIGEHSQFKIRASKLVQMKQGTAVLHDVQIELFGEDGKRVDRISGGEFEYDQKNGKVIAAGPVEITLEHPGESVVGTPKRVPGRAIPDGGSGNSPLQSAAAMASHGEIHVKTSALTFDQKTGVATTEARVEFALTQGNGSSIGATFDSDHGRLVLDRAVELNVKRGSENVVLHAEHAEFERDTLLCRMHAASASFRGGEAAAGDANILFRDDGSAARLDASNGFSMKTATAAHIAAPRGWLEFDEHNQPRRGRLEGGAALDSTGKGRQVSGSAPSADLVFASQGALQSAHLERGVTMHSEETTPLHEDKSGTRTVSRDWRSLMADLDFRPPQRADQKQVELSALHGSGGVVITGATRLDQGPVIPSRMAADEVTASFGAGQVLTSALGTGHAVLDQVTSSGTRQTTSGDRIEVNFAPASANRDLAGKGPGAAKSHPGIAGETGGAENASGALAQIESATVDGNVVLVEEPPRGSDSEAHPPLRATAGHAVYEGGEERLHLTANPRVENGALQLTADKVDVLQVSGDAFAQGSVKATWAPLPAASGGTGKKQPGGAAVPGGGALGGEGPAHIVADEAQLHQSTGEATFRGQARLWQQANSIAAPEIVLNRNRQTLVARSPNATNPVRVVMLSAAGMDTLKGGQPGSSSLSADGKGSQATATHEAKPGAAPSVIRVRGGELKYSEGERKAVINGGAAGTVVAETGMATSISKELELVLLPPGNHAGKDGSAAQVDRMIASGDVAVSSEGRRGTGQRLVYSSETGEYVLTGTAAAPPRMTDLARGSVTGASLIFNSRDDSVSIEGGGGKTSTETMAPK